MVKAAVLGAGSWGTAFAKVLADAGTDVTMWARGLKWPTRSPHPSRRLSRGVASRSIRATSDYTEALDGAYMVVLAVPSQSLRENLAEWKDAIGADATLLSLAKGIESGTLMRMSQVIVQVTGADPSRVAVVSGPNLASEIAQGQPAATVIACTDSGRAVTLQLALPPAISVRTPTPT